MNRVSPSPPDSDGPDGASVAAPDGAAPEIDAPPHVGPDLSDLLARARAGDAQARHALVSMVHETARSGILAVVGAGEPAEILDDIQHDALVAFITQIDSIDTNPHGYMYAIARRKALRYLRRKITARRREAPDGAAERLQGDATRPSSTMHARRALETVMDGLPKLLSRQELTLFTLLYVERRDKDEILVEMGITDTHFRVVKHHIEKKARRHLQDWSPDFSDG